MANARNLFNVLKKHKQDRDVRAFKELIAAPATFPISLPAGANLAVSVTAVTTYGQNIVDIQGVNLRQLGVEGGPANTIFPIGYFKRGDTVAKDVGVVSTVSLYIDNGFGRYKKIAEG